jgi:hypothetical protein
VKVASGRSDGKLDIARLGLESAERRLACASRATSMYELDLAITDESLAVR